MSMLEIADMMLYAPNFLSSEFDQMTIPKQGTYGFKEGINGFAVDYELNSQILRDFLYGTGEPETLEPWSFGKTEDSLPVLHFFA
jgi:hypothetical protein